MNVELSMPEPILIREARAVGKLMQLRLHFMINARSPTWVDEKYKEVICRLSYAFWKYINERRNGQLVFPRWYMTETHFVIPKHNLNTILWPDWYKQNPYYQNKTIEPIADSSRSDSEPDSCTE